MHAQRIATRVILTALAIAGISACSRSQGEILPASEIREKHQLTAENRPDIQLDARKVPADLAELVPLAQKWGIGDDLIRQDFQSRASDADKQALAKALAGKNARITQWLDSQPHGAGMSNEAAAFMYMQIGLEEMGLWVD